jgi:hypothetical protein
MLVIAVLRLHQFLQFGDVFVKTQSSNRSVLRTGARCT